ncbi:MAG: formate dehydrogenase accessory protein FdhE [Deltaproteobacteria bacterium]|nr:formate dehydrogenase accessory protein FdhE [Deltaproteobacteria bacterium]
MPQSGKKRAHLRETARDHPEYREILSLFQELYAHIEGKEDATGIALTFPDRHAAQKIRGGLPLLAPESLSVDTDRAVRFLSGILAVLRRAGRQGEEELARIEQSIAEGALDVGALLGACLRRDRGALTEAARSISVQSSLLAFVLEVPLKTALERVAESIDPETVGEWKEGYCPVCGSRPGMDELVGEEGKRFLSCSSCFFRWPFKRLKCPYCGNEDPGTLSYFLAGDGPTRVDVCRKCSRYIKTRDSRKGHADVPLEAEDLATLHLDLLAEREGFERGR